MKGLKNKSTGLTIKQKKINRKKIVTNSDEDKVISLNNEEDYEEGVENSDNVIDVNKGDKQQITI